jgi:hypothetical protein
MDGHQDEKLKSDVCTAIEESQPLLKTSRLDSPMFLPQKFRVCTSALVEVDGLAPYIFSDGTLTTRNQGVLSRCKDRKERKQRRSTEHEEERTPGNRELLVCRFPHLG